MRSMLAILALLTASAPAWPQDERPDPPPAEQAAASTPVPEGSPEGQQAPQGPPRFIYEVAQSVRGASVPHIDGGGDATTATTRTEFDLIWFLSMRTRAVFQVSNELAFFEFKEAFSLDPVDGDPVGSTNRQNIDVLVSHNFDRRWTVLAIGGIGLARERNADVSDSIVWRAGIGTTYQVTENISLGVSLFATAEQEGSVEFLPLPAIDATFEFDERWSLHLGTLTGAKLSYQASEELSFELRSGYNERNFRLDEDGFAPGGVFQDKSIDLRLGANWKPAPGVEITGGVGSELWRRFKISDSNGSRLTRVETDPTIVLYAGLSYRF